MGIEDKIDLESKGELEPAIKIQEIEVPRNEKELIRYLRNIRDTREFGVQLVIYSLSERFDPQKIAQLCTKEERQKLGYLSDSVLTLQEYGVLRQETIKNLTKLSTALQDSYEEWVHMGEGRREVLKLMEQELRWVSHPEINHKWRVYPETYAEDVLDWLDLYHDEYFQSKKAKKNVGRFYENRDILRIKL